MARKYEMGIHPTLILGLSGSQLALLLTGILPAVLVGFGFNIYSDSTATVLPACALVLTLIGSTYIVKSVWRHRFKFNNKAILVVVACLYFAYAFYMASLTPASGWDTLWFRSEQTNAFLDNAFKANPKPYAWAVNSSHPIFTEIIAAWGAWGGTINRTIWSPGYPLWLLSGFNLSFLAALYVGWISGNHLVGLIAGIVTFSLPLLENHLLIGGYAESLMACSIVFSVVCFDVGLRTKHHIFQIIAVLFALSLVLLKNIGAIYAGCVLAALAIDYLARVREGSQKGYWGRKKFLSLSAVLIVAMIVFLLVDKITINEHGDIFIAHHILDLVWQPAGIIRNQLVSLFINSSFGQLALVYFFCTILFFSTPHSDDRSLAGWICISLIMLFLTSSQLFQYGYANAIPGSDTGNSRFSILFICLCPVVVGELARELLGSRKQKSFYGRSAN